MHEAARFNGPGGECELRLLDVVRDLRARGVFEQRPQPLYQRGPDGARLAGLQAKPMTGWGSASNMLPPSGS